MSRMMFDIFCESFGFSTLLRLMLREMLTEYWSIIDLIIIWTILTNFYISQIRLGKRFSPAIAAFNQFKFLKSIIIVIIHET